MRYERDTRAVRPFLFSLLGKEMNRETEFRYPRIGNVYSVFAFSRRHSTAPPPGCRVKGKKKRRYRYFSSIRLASNVTSFRTIRVLVRAAGQSRTCPLCQRDRTPVLPLPDLAFVYDSICLVVQSITLFRVIKLLQTTAPDVKV